MRSSRAAWAGALVGALAVGAGALAAPGEPAGVDPEIAAALEVERRIAEVQQALAAGVDARTEARIAALLAAPGLDPKSRLWALETRMLMLYGAGRACELLPAIDAFVAEAAADRSTVLERQRARRRRAEAEVTCAQDQRPPEPPPPPPPPPRLPPSGRGTLLAGGGALLIEHRGDAPAASAITAEASLGYLWAGGLQLDGALVASWHAVAVRPGLRLDIGHPWDGAAVQLRVAGQVLLGLTADDRVRVGGGALLGLGLLVELVEDFGLLTTAEGSLWVRLDGVHVGADARLGVYYAF